MRIIHGVLILALTVTACASGQSRAPFSPLRPIGQVFLCREMPATGDKVGLFEVGFIFVEGEDMVDDREIQVGFNSLGTPTILNVTATEPGTRPPKMHALSMRFAKNGGAGFRVNVDRALREGAQGDGQVLIPLDAEALSQGRALAESLWARHCGSSRTSPNAR